MRRDDELFPIFLKLAGRSVLVVGGGVVAAGKIDALARAGAEITVVAPAISSAVGRAGLTVHERPFVPSDLDGRWLVVAAAPPDVNRAVAEAAHARHIFVNAVDDPANASAYLGGVLRRDGVTVAISTNGRAPALAGLMREGLDALLPIDLDRWFARADELKREWRSTGVPMNARRPQLLDALVKMYEARAVEAPAGPGEADASPYTATDFEAAVATHRGFASLVGAGPGDPELLTTRAIDRLKRADVVLHDGLVPREVVAMAATAEHVSVARRAGEKELTQEAVTDLIIAGVRRGQRVVRLKAGDPFVFGRGGEEVTALAHAGVPFEIVPGITSAIAAPALAGIPVTHRGLASGFVVVSGHAPESYAPVLGSVAPASVTVVVLMGIAERTGIRSCLMDAGWRGETAAAIVTSASRPDQRVWTGTLETLDTGAALAHPDDPGVIVIGDVVTLAATGGRAVDGGPEDVTSEIDDRVMIREFGK